MKRNDHTIFAANIPSSWDGYRYRCLVDGAVAPASQQVKGYLDGAVNSGWENTANWSCGILPDANTDLFIYKGTNINTNATIRSLKASPGVVTNVKTGVEFKVLK